MTNQALIYHRPSKWPIANALGAALLIHLSAVAIAFHREPIAPSTASDSIIFSVAGEDTEPLPLDPDISVAPPEPVPTADFIEPQETRCLLTEIKTPPRFTGRDKIGSPLSAMERHSLSARRGLIIRTKRAAATSLAAALPSSPSIPLLASPST